MKPLYVKKNGVVYRVSGTGIPSIYPAANVEYDNTVTSELQATDVQDAIDELSTRQGGVQSDWDEDDSTELDYIKNKPENLVQDANYVHTDNNYDATAKGKVDALGTASTKDAGVANGVAELDSAGKVPSSQLPSFVDDVIEVADYDHLPITGESGKIYVTLDTNKTYRWTGSGYAEISESLALGETSSTAYRGDRGKTAYDHATETKLSTATTSGLYKVAATAQGHIASLTAVEKSDITALGIPAQDTTYGVVSKTANGLAPQLPNETTTTKYLRQDGSWQVPPDNNTTYTVATGDSNGQIKVTPSSGSAYNVGVKGLGSAAYANLANTVMEVGKSSSRSTATVGTWTAMCNSTQAGSPTLPSANNWWNIISLNNWSDSAANWVSQLAIATQQTLSGVWWRANDAGGTSIDSSTWHRLAEGDSAGNATNANKVNNLTVQTAVPANAKFTDVDNTKLPLAGGNMTGASGIQFPTTSGNNKSGNWISAGGGYSTGSGKSGLKILACEQADCVSGLGQDCGGGPYELSIVTGASTAGDTRIRFLSHKVASPATYTQLAELQANGNFVCTSINGYTVAKSVPSNAVFTDTNNAVTQNATDNTNANYEVLFSVTADNTTRTEGARKTQYFKYNSSKQSLMVGNGCVASGKNSHAFGLQCTSSGDYSFASGEKVKATDEDAHAEGYQTSATGMCSHAECNRTLSYGASSHAEGVLTTAYGSGSHTEGQYTSAQGKSAHAEGYYSTAAGSSSDYTGVTHAEGYYTLSSGGYGSHAEGYYTLSSGAASHAEGSQTTASSDYSHAEGYCTKATGSCAHAEGSQTTASGQSSHAEGSQTTASHNYAHAEGYGTRATMASSHAEGLQTIASGQCSHAEGYTTTASGQSSHTEGYVTLASNQNSHACGHYNAAMTNGGNATNTTGTAFVIGNGTSASALKNAFSVQFNGVVKAASTITASTTADYAEYFEWADENPNNEDRVGYFVTFDDGNEIRFATSEDDYILGVTSGEPFVLGNGDCDVWNGMVLRDEFRRIIYEPAPDYIEIKGGGRIPHLDKDGNPVYCGTRPKLNPNYDPTKPYINRADRPEWCPVGMLGVLAVRDDGTCEVNGYATITDNAIATKYTGQNQNKYRVIRRNTQNVVEIVFR